MKHIFFLLTSLTLVFATGAGAASRIYKTVDADGNVVFTDIPPRENEPAEAVEVQTGNTFSSNDASGPRDQWIVDGASGDGEDEEAEEAPFVYNSLEIKSPANDEAVRENAGNVTVVAVAKPRLQMGHKMRLVMDGSVKEEGYQSDFALANVDRGTHTITTEIIDGNGNVLIRSDKSVFHLQRVARGGG